MCNFRAVVYSSHNRSEVLSRRGRTIIAEMLHLLLARYFIREEQLCKRREALVHEGEV